MFLADSNQRLEGKGHVAFHVVRDSMPVATGISSSPIVTVLRMVGCHQINVMQVELELLIVPFPFNYPGKRCICASFP